MNRERDSAAIRAMVKSAFAHFGRNKTEQIARLALEISRRENEPVEKILVRVKEGGGPSFPEVKSSLIDRRYPALNAREKANVPFFPLPAENFPAVPLTGMEFYPRRVHYEQGLNDHPLTRRFRARFPQARFQQILSYRDYSQDRPYSLCDYNQRREMIFIVQEHYDFLQQCPCTPGALPCGYFNLNLGYGCAYDCAYCFLQGYTNAAGLVFPANLGDYFDHLRHTLRPGMRVGTGQNTDSLFLDDVTHYSTELLEFFRSFPEVRLELKTKSDCIENLLQVSPPDNVVISWSVNPEVIVSEVEAGTASLQKRVEAARRCAEQGYQVAFHFDPIVRIPAWREEYSRVVEQIFKSVPSHKISWISLGCLRMTKSLYQAVEKRFPASYILLEEQVLGYDDKIRYPRRFRDEMYAFIRDKIFSFDPERPVYLCMESPDICRSLELSPRSLSV